MTSPVVMDTIYTAAEPEKYCYHSGYT